jgi:peptide deformylase
MKTIVQDGDPVLRQIAVEVPEAMFGTKELADLLHDMEEALDAERDGVALAAPQIGASYRIFIVRYDKLLNPPPEGHPPHAKDVGIYINPEFVKTARKMEEMDEGCLSVRGTYGTTVRHTQATVQAQRADGSWFERGAGGVLAQAFQHEIDHLDGVLFIDHAIGLHEHASREHHA